MRLWFGRYLIFVQRWGDVIKVSFERNLTRPVPSLLLLSSFYRQIQYHHHKIHISGIFSARVNWHEIILQSWDSLHEFLLVFVLITSCITPPCHGCVSSWCTRDRTDVSWEENLAFFFIYGSGYLGDSIPVVAMDASEEALLSGWMWLMIYCYFK